MIIHLPTLSYTIAFSNDRALMVDDYSLSIVDEQGETFNFGIFDYCAPGALENLILALSDSESEEQDWSDALDCDVYNWSVEGNEMSFI